MMYWFHGAVMANVRLSARAALLIYQICACARRLGLGCMYLLRFGSWNIESGILTGQSDEIHFRQNSLSFSPTSISTTAQKCR